MCGLHCFEYCVAVSTKGNEPDIQHLMCLYLRRMNRISADFPPATPALQHPPVSASHRVQTRQGASSSVRCHATLPAHVAAGQTSRAWTPGPRVSAIRSRHYRLLSLDSAQRLPWPGVADYESSVRIVRAFFTNDSRDKRVQDCEEKHIGHDPAECPVQRQESNAM
jgi:hypothetical protein